MSKFIVRAITGGTGVNLQMNGRNPQAALARARKHRYAKTACIFMVFDRVTGFLLLTEVVR